MPRSCAAASDGAIRRRTACSVKADGNTSRLRIGRPDTTNLRKHFQEKADGQTPTRRRQARVSERRWSLRRSKNAGRCCASGETHPSSVPSSDLGRTPTGDASFSRLFFLSTKPSARTVSFAHMLLALPRLPLPPQRPPQSIKARRRAPPLPPSHALSAGPARGLCRSFIR